MAIFLIFILMILVHSCRVLPRHLTGPAPEYLDHIDILSCSSFFGYDPDGGVPEGGVLFTIPPGGRPEGEVPFIPGGILSDGGVPFIIPCGGVRFCSPDQLNAGWSLFFISVLPEDVVSV